MEIDAIFEQLPETANACPDLVRVGRYCNVELLAIRAGEAAGREFWSYTPRPGFVSPAGAGPHRGGLNVTA